MGTEWVASGRYKALGDIKKGNRISGAFFSWFVLRSLWVFGFDFWIRRRFDFLCTYSLEGHQDV
ncbi:hypothetical protein BDV38DRAFT_258368, partial [Aspergillus pseudotamarii]